MSKKIHQLAASFQMKMHALGRSGDLDGITRAVEEFVNGCVGEGKARVNLAGMGFLDNIPKVQKAQDSRKSAESCIELSQQTTTAPEQDSTEATEE